MRIAIVFMALAAGCGSAAPAAPATGPEPKLTAEDLKPRAVLSRAELTTAADEQRMRATAPVTTSFADRVGAIYLVATLKRLPTDADIDVRWFKDSDSEPRHTSHANASDRFEFVSSFRPSGPVFDPGTYTVRVYVDGEEVGAAGFRVGSSDRPAVAVDDLALSQIVDEETMEPRSRATSFKSGTKRIHASFAVRNAEPGNEAIVIWMREGEEFFREAIPVNGSQRYAALIEERKGLPDGSYAVRVEVGADTSADRSFSVGERTGNGPAVDRAGLGLELDNENAPSPEMTSFGRDTPVIQCGLRFVDLPRDSKVDVQWFSTEADGDMLLHTTRTNISSGGTGTMGAAWEPGHALHPGAYKAVVLVNGEAKAELPFEIR